MSSPRRPLRAVLSASLVVGLATALLPASSTPSAATTGGGVEAPVEAATAAPLVNSCPRPASGMRVEHDGPARTVALTFDDGPHPVYTPAVLDELDRLGVRATFFVVGRRVERHPDIARRIVESGHVIANHTYTHPLVPHMDELPIATREDEIDRATAAIVAATGVRPCAFRSPGSNHRSSTTQRLANERALRVAHWTHNSRDDFKRTDDRRRSVEAIVTRSTEPQRSRPVVLLHDGGGADTFRGFTVDALEPLVRAYRSRGYGFVDVAGEPFRRVDRALLPACGVPAQTVGGYRDVAVGSTHRPGIVCAGRWGVASGRSSTSFAPSESVTRAQVATMLHGLLRGVGHRPTTAPGVRFSDVGASVHRQAIEELAAAGIVAGRRDGTFGPNDAVRRDQVASMLIRTLHVVGGERPAGRVRFSDVDPGSVHADAIGRLAGAGVVKGVTPSTFAPDAPVSRAQMATFAMRSAAVLVREGHGTTR